MRDKTRARKPTADENEIRNAKRGGEKWRTRASRNTRERGGGVVGEERRTTERERERYKKKGGGGWEKSQSANPLIR